jgi:hypothetical protein
MRSIALSDPLIARLAEAVHPILSVRHATVVVIDHGGTKWSAGRGVSSPS